MFGGTHQPNEDSDGVSFLFGHPVRCCARCGFGTGKPEIADSVFGVQDSEAAAKTLDRFLRYDVHCNAFVLLPISESLGI